MSIARLTSTFVRPNDATQYTANDLVANSTTAGSVVPLTFSGVRPGFVTSVGLWHTDQDATGSTFRIWLLNTSPVVSNGDNGALAGVAASTVLGTVPITADNNSGDTYGIAYLANGRGLYVPAVFYGLIEATGTYTPLAEETFGVTVVVDPH